MSYVWCWSFLPEQGLSHPSIRGKELEKRGHLVEVLVGQLWIGKGKRAGPVSKPSITQRSFPRG